jgi:uncharacterized membrane protein
MMGLMSSHRTQLLRLCLLLGVTACGPDKDTGSPTEAADICDTGGYTPSWEGWTQGFFRTYCSACHAETALDRHGAPAGVFFDTEAQVAAQSATIRRVVLIDGSMPVGGGALAEDLLLLERALDCGIPGD